MFARALMRARVSFHLVLCGRLGRGPRSIHPIPSQPVAHHLELPEMKHQHTETDLEDAEVRRGDRPKRRRRVDEVPPAARVESN